MEQQSLEDFLQNTSLSAQSGTPHGQYYLGWLYRTGRGVQKSNAEAIKWWKLAAENGSVDAQYALGSIYRRGDGLLKSGAEAVKWWKLAAESGSVDAQYALGWIYRNGDGVHKNNAEAVKWWKLAAENGETRAQGNLGGMYLYGKGTRKNLAEALRLLRTAASSGDANAQYTIGFSRERAIPLDERMEWLHKAADNGHFMAQRFLAVLYASGSVVERRDLVTALKLIIQANRTKNSIPSRAIYFAIRLFMNKEQVAEANRLAKDAPSAAAQDNPTEPPAPRD